MCWAGCLATRYCGFLIFVINTMLLGGYLYGLFVECGSGCYLDNEHPDRLPLATAIVGPITLFVFGYIIAFIAWYRGKGVIGGCHHVLIVIWLMLLAISGVLCAWNGWNMVHHDIGNGGLAIYDDMVYAVVIWNLLLMLMSCNVMIKADDEDWKRKGLSMVNATSYQSVEEDAFDHRTEISCHEL